MEHVVQGVWKAIKVEKGKERALINFIGLHVVSTCWCKCWKKTLHLVLSQDGNYREIWEQDSSLEIRRSQGTTEIRPPTLISIPSDILEEQPASSCSILLFHTQCLGSCFNISINSRPLETFDWTINTSSLRSFTFSGTTPVNHLKTMYEEHARAMTCNDIGEPLP